MAKENQRWNEAFQGQVHVNAKILYVGPPIYILKLAFPNIGDLSFTVLRPSKAKFQVDWLEIGRKVDWEPELQKVLKQSNLQMNSIIVWK